MKKYFVIPTILLTATIASGSPSPNERFSHALDKIKEITSKLEASRTRARQQRDSIKFACINDATRQVYAATKQLESRYANPSDLDAQVAEEVLSRVSTISSEADSCQGNTLITTFEGYKVSPSIDPTIASIDPNSSTPPLVIDPPACASCFR
jgi:Tfp pilus assembly protein FimT